MNRLFFFLLTFSFLFLFPSSPALAAETCAIKSINVSIEIKDDMSLETLETITQDCQDLPDKHGLFRIIPATIKKPVLIETPITVVSVTNERDEKLPYETKKQSGNLIVKIGNPNKLITGVNTYKLNYVVGKVIGENNGQGELYWDLLGTAWETSIESFRADVTFPKRVTEFNTTIRIYDGQEGSQTNTLTNYRWFDGGDGKRKLTILSNGEIPKGNGVTLSAISSAAEFKPYIPTTQERYGHYFWLILPGVIGLASLLIWRRYGRDPLKHLPELVYYEPPHKLLPLELGFVQGYGKINNNFITATVIDLSVKGYLQIQQVEVKKLLGTKKSWQFILRNPDTSILKSYERIIINKLFGEGAQADTAVEIEELHNQFYTVLASIRDAVEEELRPYKLFEKKSYAFQVTFIIMAVLLASAGLVALINPTTSLSLRYLGVSLLISGIPVVIAGIFMSKRTEAGARIEHEIEGFKLYLGKAEKYRMEYYEKVEIFERYLPYAIGFGLTKEWLKRMHDVYREKNVQLVVWPWLMPLDGSINSFASFTDSIDGLISRTSSVVASSPSSSSSSGGGGVGGGGGGGGGGSW